MIDGGVTGIPVTELIQSVTAMTDERIIPACEDFSTIAAALREIERVKQQEREKAPVVEYPDNSDCA